MTSVGVKHLLWAAVKGPDENLIFWDFIQLITYRIDFPVFELFGKVVYAHVFEDMKSACAVVAEKHWNDSAIALKVEDVGGGRQRRGGRRRSEVVAELEEVFGLRRAVDEEREASESCIWVTREQWARHVEVAAADVNVESRSAFYAIGRYATAVGEVDIREVRSQKRTGPRAHCALSGEIHVSIA